MKILVYGAGSIGCLFGALVSPAHEVTLLGRPALMNGIREHGLTIRTPEGEKQFTPETALTLPPGRSYNLVVIAVKAHALGEAYAALRDLPEEPDAFLLLQNGIGNEETVRGRIEDGKIIRGLAFHGASWNGPGDVTWHPYGPLMIGRPHMPAGEESMTGLAELAGALSIGSYTVRAAEDIRRELWNKLIVNASINPLGAISGQPNGALIRSPSLRSVLRALILECQWVARQEAGYRFDLTDTIERMILKTGENRNSMLVDIESGNRTEIDFLNGAIIRFAEKHDIPVPVNRTIISLIKKKESRSPS